MTWRCRLFGHAVGAPFRDREDGRVKVRCGECLFISEGVELPPPPRVTAPITSRERALAKVAVDLAAWKRRHQIQEVA